MSQQALGQYVSVLEQRVDQAQASAVQAQAALRRTQDQLQRLQAASQAAALKKAAGNVALFSNAAGFRSSVMEIAAHMRDACNVQQLECAQAQRMVQQAMQRHRGVQDVWQQGQRALVQAQARQAQKMTDEMAANAWMRQQHSQPTADRDGRES